MVIGRLIGFRHVLAALALLCALPSPPAIGQELADDMVGQTKESWALWQEASTAVEREETDKADALMGRVLAMDLSDLRLALMADRTGSLRLEQMAESADVPANVKSVADKVRNGRRQKELAEDGWHFAAIGRFEYADANFKALDESNPDPVALLELARMNPGRERLLVKLVANADVGPSAKRMIQLLGEGEQRLRMDPYEIAQNVEKLAGTAREVYHALGALRDSGEYAVPHLVQYLHNAKYQSLHPAIIKALPELGRAGLNPMVQALAISDTVVKKVLIETLAKIGYRQALPYLVKIANGENEDAECRTAARSAIMTLGGTMDPGVSRAFYELADGYYRNEESLRADPRIDMANVWYFVDDKLRYVPVPTPIFNDVMAMRCSEEALKADADNAEAVALWLAGNIRRESKLGLNVESDQADPMAAKDATRPADYPRSIYFARAAGPMYNHRVLGLAVRDRDPGVALGSIAALSATAGEASLVGAEDIKQPLVQALTFPNRQVRIKAALAIAQALPSTPFDQSYNVLPVLGEALTQSGRQTALIADPEENTRNKLQALLRANGFDCALGSSVSEARSDGEKTNITSYDLVLLASDVENPDLAGAIADVRHDFKTAATPILIVAKSSQTVRASNLARGQLGVEVLLVDVLDLGDPAKIGERVIGTYQRAAAALGMAPLDNALSLDLAIRAADALRLVAEHGRSVFELSRAVSSLVKAMSNPSEALRVKCANALALIGGPEAQSSIAESALNAEHANDERVAAFNSLAESARRGGNQLGEEPINRIIDLSMHEKDLVLQAAASKALGALDLPSNKASEIIRSQSRG